MPASPFGCLYLRHMLHARHVLPAASCRNASHCMGRAQYNKLIMIDRTFYGSETPNPTGVKASEYDVVSGANRDLTSGIQTNSWCSAVRAISHRAAAGYPAYLCYSHALWSPSSSVHPHA